MADIPPAYPCKLTVSDPHSLDQWTEEFPGMTLLDYFAGQALNQASREIWENHKPEDVAARCYNFAEAMLAEREKRND